MTAERRQVKHALQNAVKKNLSLDFRLNTTANQQKQAAKIITDQLLAGRNPTEFVVLA